MFAPETPKTNMDASPAVPVPSVTWTTIEDAAAVAVAHQTSTSSNLGVPIVLDDLLAKLVATTTRGLDVMARAGQSADDLEPVAEAAFRSLPLTRTLADSYR